MLSRKQRLIALLACGCLAAILIFVTAYRRLHHPQPIQDITTLLEEVEATTGLNTDGIKVTGNAKSPEVIARLVKYMEAPDSITTDKTREAAMAALARIGGPAVPKLIEAIGNAPDTAAAIPFANEAKWPERFIRTGEGKRMGWLLQAISSFDRDYLDVPRGTRHFCTSTDTAGASAERAITCY